jgi:hypothetical protein
MAKNNYLPRTDEERVTWFNNFANKFAVYAAGLGFTPAEVTAVTNDAAMLAYLLLLTEIYTTAKAQRVTYKNLIKDGPIGSVGGPIPAAPVAPAAPTVVAPGILPRLALLVQRIKASTTYTEAIGHDLGIIGSQQTTDPTKMKPTLKLVMKGGQVEVQWVKADSDGIRIEVDRGTGTWSFLAIDTVPHYPDTTPITGPATWKYRAMYIVADEPVGQWSDVASIAVS